MNRFRTLSGVIVTLVALTVGGLGAQTFAEEGSAKAMAAWKGRAFVFPVGQDQAYLVGVYSGILYVDNGKGPLHAASIVCPATGEGDLKTRTKTGQGRCILTDEDGNRIYARFTCSGDLESCRGPFTIEGGTGKFTGITGEGEMISHMQVRQLTTVVGFESVEQQGEGVAVWPSIHYTIPDAKQ